jgi:hypothetical protein
MYLANIFNVLKENLDNKSNSHKTTTIKLHVGCINNHKEFFCTSVTKN